MAIDGGRNAIFQPVRLPGNGKSTFLFQPVELVHGNRIVIFAAGIAAAGNDPAGEMEARPPGRLRCRIIHQRVLAGPTRADNYDHGSGHRTQRLAAKPAILSVAGHATRLP